MCYLCIAKQGLLFGPETYDLYDHDPKPPETLLPE